MKIMGNVVHYKQTGKKVACPQRWSRCYPDSLLYIQMDNICKNGSAYNLFNFFDLTPPNFNVVLS